MPKLGNQAVNSTEDVEEEEIVHQVENDEDQTQNSVTDTAGASDMASAHRAVETAKTTLLASKNKQFIFTFADSEYMTAVKNSITALNGLLKGQVPSDPAERTKALAALRSAYGTMISACEAYVDNITSRKRGKSTSGKLRLSLTKQILEQSRKEAVAFGMAEKDLFGNSEPGGNWDDVLYGVRAEKLDVKDPNIKQYGAGTSVVYRRQEKDGGSTWIKAEENLARIKDDTQYLTFVDMYAGEDGPNAAGISKMVHDAMVAEISKENYDSDASIDSGLYDVAMEILRASAEMKEGKGLQESIDQQAADLKRIQKEKAFAKIKEKVSEGVFGSLAKYIESHMDEFYSLVKYVARKRNEYIVATDFSSANIEEGEAISNRNVSTSRMSEKYGLTDTVASSKSMLIQKEDGTYQRANGMEGVETVAMGLLSQYAKKNKKIVRYSPNAIRQLFQLQVFDLICGQIDRHAGNYNAFFEQPDENTYYVTSIKGIDNDMSFGQIDYSLGDKAVVQQKGILDKATGKLSVPFLPKDFYDKMMAYTPEMAAYDQADLRSKKELDALKGRITFIQKQVSDLVNAGKITLLETKEEWEQAIKKLNEMKNANNLGASYLSFDILGNS